MKKILILFCFVLLFISCTKTPEQKAQKQIKEYLAKVLNDTNSYEPVSFGTLTNNDMSGKYVAEYYLSHTYRAKNLFGGIETKTYKFYLSFENYNVLGMEK